MAMTIREYGGGDGSRPRKTDGPHILQRALVEEGQFVFGPFPGKEIGALFISFHKTIVLIATIKV